MSANRSDPVMRRMIWRTGIEGQIATIKRKQRYGEQNCRRQQNDCQHVAQTTMFDRVFCWFPSHDCRLKKVTELTIKFQKGKRAHCCHVTISLRPGAKIDLSLCFVSLGERDYGPTAAHEIS